MLPTRMETSAILSFSPDPLHSVKPRNDDNFDRPLREINMGDAIYSSPVAANKVLYIATKNCLFAIGDAGEQQPQQGGGEPSRSE